MELASDVLVKGIQVNSKIMTTIENDGGDELGRYLDVLSAPRRRYILYYLHEHRSSNIAELAEYILQCETDQSISEILEDDRHSVEVDLYHRHLPHLDEAHLVRFDKRNKDVRIESTPIVFRAFLWICHVYEDPP